MAKPAPNEPETRLFERLRHAAKVAAANGDAATHATLYELDLSLSDAWHRLERATKKLTGEPLALVRQLQRNL